MDSVVLCFKLKMLWPCFTAVDSAVKQLLFCLYNLKFSINPSLGARNVNFELKSVSAREFWLVSDCDCLSCRQATNANPLDKILHGSVGYLTPRSGGTCDSLLKKKLTNNNLFVPDPFYGWQFHIRWWKIIKYKRAKVFGCLWVARLTCQDASWGVSLPQVSWWTSNITCPPMICLRMALEPPWFCMRTMVGELWNCCCCLKEGRK